MFVCQEYTDTVGVNKWIDRLLNLKVDVLPDADLMKSLLCALYKVSKGDDDEIIQWIEARLSDNVITSQFFDYYQCTSGA